MKLLGSFALVLAGVVALAAVSSEAGEKKKKSTAGVVVKVDAESLTIKVAEKKKKDQVVAPAREVSFKLTAATKVEKAGAKKDDPTTPATAADIAVGGAVAVTGAEGGAAERVLIMGKKKKAA